MKCKKIWLPLLLTAAFVFVLFTGCDEPTEIPGSSSETVSTSESETETPGKVFYDFKDYASVKEGFFYIYSPICKAFGEFKQDADGIVNFRNDESIAKSAGDTEVPSYFPDNPDEFAYISMLTKEKYSVGTKVTLHCSFDKMGAPLVAFTDDINEGGEHTIYGRHFEVVAYNDGCNVWEIRPSLETKEWPIDPTLIAEPKFPIADGEPVEIIVEFGDGEITETVNGHTETVTIPDMPDTFHVGITACEGINHFYDFTIETPVAYK